MASSRRPPTISAMPERDEIAQALLGARRWLIRRRKERSRVAVGARKEAASTAERRLRSENAALRAELEPPTRATKAP